MTREEFYWIVDKFACKFRRFNFSRVARSVEQELSFEEKTELQGIDEAAEFDKELTRFLHSPAEFCRTAGGDFGNYKQVAQHFYTLGKEAGAKWMSEQGVVAEVTIDEFSPELYNKCVDFGLTIEDKVIVQIRKPCLIGDGKTAALCYKGYYINAVDLFDAIPKEEQDTK